MHNDLIDMLVIGGGTAGLVGAKVAASFGASVVLAERARTGGDCLWTGCIPSKSLVACAALQSRTQRTMNGIHREPPAMDFAAIRRHIQGAIQTIEPADSPKSLKAAGVRYINGNGRFTAPNRALIGGEEIQFRQAMIATGAAPLVPDIPGLSSIQTYTSDTIWDREELPQRLTILGGGPIACELGQAFARLGANVTIVGRATRLLAREDSDAARIITKAMNEDGVDIHTGCTIQTIEPGDDPYQGTAIVDDGSAHVFDALLVAIGRKPRTSDLGLEYVGVELDARGHVIVDTFLRTNNPWIRAAGDVTAHPNFTHVAGVHGSLAATNAILGNWRQIDQTAIPRVTFTSPEVASIGVATDEGGCGSRYRILHVSHAHLDRAVTTGETNGFTKIAVDDKGTIVGGTIVGPRAGETLGELTLAVKQGIRTREMAGVMHAYPTYNDAVWNASVGDLRRRLQAPPLRRILATAVTIRRRWVTLRQRSKR